MQSILVKLGQALPFVQSPARYMGGEANSVVRPLDEVQGSMALVFPDTYEIGMSHNGTKVLYHCINREPDLLAEVAFAPWEDMITQMERWDIPLYSHASWTPVRNFDVVGISLQTELNFTNIPLVLELAGINPWAQKRKDDEPIVVGGGPSMGNPEPVADFFDLMILGDGEEIVPKMLRWVGKARREGKNRTEILAELHSWDGIYVPTLHSVRAKSAAEGIAGELVPEIEAKGSYLRTEGVRRIWLEELKPEYYPVRNLIANMPLIHDRYAIEISRGCTQGCRFCQAGVWYRPSRELPPDEVMRLAEEGIASTGERQVGLLSLSSADYSQIEPLTDAIIEQPLFDSVDVSLPSLRANSFGQSLAGKVAALKGGRSATFAPETGSERLRHVINKTLSDQDMVEAAEGVFANGFNRIKLYTMIGLPTETLEDMEAFCGLIEKLVAVGLKYTKKFTIQVSVGVLVPKAFTAFQWASFMDKEQVYTHLRFVRERFYRHKNVRVNYSSWEVAHLESVYSRGDRRLAPLIYEAYKRGMIFESHGEKLNYHAWTELWEDFNFDTSWVYQERSSTEVFPWDFIHAGLTKGYLLNEWRAALNPESSPVSDCKWGDCHHCGIPGHGEDIKLACSPEVYAAPSRSPEEIKALVESRRPSYGEVYHYKFTFKKTGISRFLPHQNTLNFFERSLTRLNIPIKFSEGFSPKPRIHNTGALPLGLESLCEVVSIQLLEELPLQGKEYEELLSQISAPFPVGMEVVQIEPLQQKLSQNPPQSVEYHTVLSSLPTELEARYAQKNLGKVVNHRGVEINVDEHIKDLQIEKLNDKYKISICARANKQGNTISPFVLFAGILEIPEAEARSLLVVKSALAYES
ncbi:MAG: TIGR03960 family B12-binding radical SAM protein [Fibrobacter sp.]|nr:TIGR03960 family B12-binding radical SAM protein [Fibrobacter sp.]